MDSVIVDSRSRSRRLCCNLLWTLLISCCVSRIFTILNVYTLIGKGDRTRHTNCREFLASGCVKNNDFRQNGCRASRYNKSDVAQCMNRTQLSTKRRNYFLFIGDSRVREQYHLFVEAIASKPYQLEANKGSSKYSGELFDTEFQWNAYMTSIPNLKELLTRRKPTFVVVGFGMWYLKDSGGRLQPGLRQYSDQVRRLSVELNQLSIVTEVIFMANAPLFRHYAYNTVCEKNMYSQLAVDERNNNSVCFNPWMRNNWVKEYNEAAVRELSNNSRSTYLWLTSRTVALGFAFDTVDSMHLYSIFDTVPPSPALHLRAQMLLNFHCNQFRDPDTGNDDVGVCCGRKDR